MRLINPCLVAKLLDNDFDFLMVATIYNFSLFPFLMICFFSSSRIDTTHIVKVYAKHVVLIM